MTDKPSDTTVTPFVTHNPSKTTQGASCTLSLEDKINLLLSLMGQSYTPSKAMHATMFIRHWEVNRTFTALALYIAEITGQVDRLWGGGL